MSMNAAGPEVQISSVCVSKEMTIKNLEPWKPRHPSTAEGKLHSLYVNHPENEWTANVLINYSSCSFLKQDSPSCTSRAVLQSSHLKSVNIYQN